MCGDLSYLCGNTLCQDPKSKESKSHKWKPVVRCSVHGGFIDLCYPSASRTYASAAACRPPAKAGTSVIGVREWSVALCAGTGGA